MTVDETTTTLTGRENKMSWKRIEAEIAKCDVRCANCHRRRTASDQGWHALLMKAS